MYTRVTSNSQSSSCFSLSSVGIKGMHHLPWLKSSLLANSLSPSWKKIPHLDQAFTWRQTMQGLWMKLRGITNANQCSHCCTLHALWTPGKGCVSGLHEFNCVSRGHYWKKCQLPWMFMFQWNMYLVRSYIDEGGGISSFKSAVHKIILE